MLRAFTSQAHGPENTNPYLAIYSRRKWRCSTPSITAFNRAAIAKGTATNNRFVQLLLVINTQNHPLPVASSTDGLAVKVAQARCEQQGVEKDEADDYGEQREMRKLGNHRGAQAFAGVDERIYEHGFLQNREFFERAPGIVRAAEENHGSDDEAEHQADVGLLHAAAERETTGRREKSHQRRHKREKQRMGNVEVNTGAKQQPSGGNDHEARGQRLQRTGDNLLNGEPGDFHGSEQP